MSVKSSRGQWVKFYWYSLSEIRAEISNHMVYVDKIIPQYISFICTHYIYGEL